MEARHTQADLWLAVVVVVHLVISVIHGMAHSGAQVLLSPAGNLFVYIVILAGPIAGLIVQRMTAGTAGAWLIALTMAGALVFGVVNHFVIDSADHVRHVTGPWGLTFGVTAGLLAASEAAGTAVGLWSASLRGGRR